MLPMGARDDPDLAKERERLVQHGERLRKQMAQEQALAVEWEKKAMLAIKAGNDDLAKQALQRKAEHERAAYERKSSLWDHERALERLEQGLAVGAVSATSSVAVPSLAPPERSSPAASTPERPAPALPLGDADLDAQLAALKQKMGVAPTTRRTSLLEQHPSLKDLVRALLALKKKKKDEPPED